MDSGTKGTQIMKALTRLFRQNRSWAGQILKQQPDFFEKLSHQQTPQYLWIGCSDSRVPANEIVGLLPGELFVHRNVANVVVHTDLNCLSVIQYAIDVLHVKHVIVCGHYGCGGVTSALRRQRLGLIDNWLRHVQDVMEKHPNALSSIKDEAARCRRLCELNVIEQVVNVCETTIVQDAWTRGQAVSVHGWIYGIDNGLLKELQPGITNPKEILPAYTSALSKQP